MGKVIAICRGNINGRPKNKISRAYLKKNYGIEGDIHAGSGNRQVSLLAWEDIKVLRTKGIKAKPGDFAENIITKEINFSELTLGVRLKVGAALLEITEIGKKEWKPGDYSFKGIPLVAKSGVFARVLQSGWSKPGDEVQMII